MLSLSSSKRALLKRLDYLRARTKTGPVQSYTTEEMAAIRTAIAAMDVLRSYGYIAVTAYGPYFSQQTDSEIKYPEARKRTAPG